MNKESFLSGMMWIPSRKLKFIKGADEDSIVTLAQDSFLGAKLSIDTDLLVLSVATVPAESNKE